jgi:hypothetical protein
VVLSFPCLRMFFPFLLAGAVDLWKPPRAKGATRELDAQSREDQAGSHPPRANGSDVRSDVAAPHVRRTGSTCELEPTAPIFLGGHAGRAMKRSCEVGLRGEMRIERYFR